MNTRSWLLPFPLGAEGYKPTSVGHAFGAVAHTTIFLGGVIGAVTDVPNPRYDKVDVDDNEDQKER